MFDYNKKVTVWEDTGTEPPEGLRKWQAGEKPPAAWWNWFWDAVQKCFEDIKSWINGHQDANTGVHGVGTGYIETVEGAQTKVNNGILAHQAASDPHPQYFCDADFAAFNGAPIGCIQFVPYATIPDGWLECNGQVVSRTAFAELFAKIGTTFGAGDGVTTFKIPDLRGEFIRGWDHGRGIDSGRQLGSWQQDEFKSHYHETDLEGPKNDGPTRYAGIMDYLSHATTNTFPSGGSETRPRNVALVAIIKAKNIMGSDPMVAGANADTLDGLHSSAFLLTTQGVNFKNKIINGNFDIWQRGTSLTTTIGYLADRWRYNSLNQGGAPVSATLSRQTFTLGQEEVPNEPKYFLRITNTSQGSGLGNDSYHVITQWIESVRTLAGKKATLSFYARSSILNKIIAAEIFQYFGDGGTPSSAVYVGNLRCNLTSSWQKFILTVDIPSISGKTLGTSGNDFLALNFFFQNGSNRTSRVAGVDLTWQGIGNIDIAQVQLEEGTTATNFELRPIGTELSLCQRYYFKSLNNEYRLLLSAYTVNCWGALKNISLPVTMRTTPTLVLYDVQGNPGKVSFLEVNSISNGGCQRANVNSVEIWNGCLTNPGEYFMFGFSVDAEL